MIKKLGLIVLGMMVVTFTMAAVPRDKAEAGKVQHRIIPQSSHCANEWGQSSISGGWWRGFTTWRGYAEVNYSKVEAGLRTHVAIMRCGRYDRKYAYVYSSESICTNVYLRPR